MKNEKEIIKESMISETRSSPNQAIGNFHINSITEDNEKFLLDKIISNYGYKFHTFKHVLGVIFSLFLGSFVIFNPINYQVFLKNEFELPNQIFLVMNVSSLLILIFCTMFCRFLVEKKYISRTALIMISLILYLISFALLCIKYSVVVYVINITLSAIFSTGFSYMTYNILSESLPTFFRGFFITITGIGYNLSDLCQNLLIKSFSRNNIVNMSMILLINGIILVILSGFIFFTCEDSPRHLLLQEENEKAFLILEKMKGENLTIEEKETLKAETIKNKIFNENNKGVISQLFSRRYLKITSIFLSLRTLNSFLGVGVSYCLPTYFEMIIPNSDIEKVGSIYFNYLLIYFLAYPLGGILMEISFLGRKYTLIALEAISIVLITIFLFNISTYFILAFAICCQIAVTFSLQTFLTETYPINLRPMAITLSVIFNFLGHFLSIIVNMNLININIYTPFIVNLAFKFVVFILFFFIDHDTHNRDLDFIIKKDDGKKLASNQLSEEELIRLKEN